MDYSKIYEQLMQNAIDYPKDEIYKELHHIVPKCMGGTDNKSNLVHLTARQHFLAHWLLYKIHKTSSLVHAWHSMSRIGKGQEHRKINSHLFEYCKKHRSKLLSESSKGKNNHFYGKHHTDEVKLKMRKLHKELKLWETRSETHRKNLLASQQKPKTAEHRSKIGRPGYIMLQHIHTLEIIRVPPTDIRATISEWVNPRKIVPEKKYKCEHCNIVTGAGNLKRWHNDNCKKRKIL